MAVFQEKFKGFNILIDEGDHLMVDGKPVKVKKEGSYYYCNELPYTRYKSLQDLARDLVDKSADYDTIGN